MQTTLKRTGHSDSQSSDSTLHPAQTSEINKHWLQIKPFIDRALEWMEDPNDIDYIYNELMASDRQCWIVRNDGEIQAVILTVIWGYRGKKTGVLTHAGGEDFRAWESSVDHIAEYFKAVGCTKFEISGRRGWKKFMENRDFKEVRTIFERKL